MDRNRIIAALALVAVVIAIHGRAPRLPDLRGGQVVVETMQRVQARSALRA